MSEIYSRIEDDITGNWVQDWAEVGVDQAQDNLKKHAAFGDWLMSKGLDQFGTSTFYERGESIKPLPALLGETAIVATIEEPLPVATDLLTQIEG